jgi:hypothetical protein
MRMRQLLNRDALSQVSRLVYVAASADGYVIAEELEADDFVVFKCSSCGFRRG